MGDSFASTRSYRTIIRTSVLAAADVVGLLAAFLLAYQLRAAEHKPFGAWVPFSEFALLSVLLIPAWVVIFIACGLYSTRQSLSRLGEFGRIAVAVTLGVSLLIIVEYLHIGAPFFPGRKVPIYALFLGIVLVLAARTVARLLLAHFFRRGKGLHNIVVIGTGPLAERVSAGLVRSIHDNRVVAAVSSVGAGSTLASGQPVYASVEHALDSHHLRIDEIVHADPTMDRAQTTRLMEFASAKGLGYRFVPDMYGVYAAGSTMSMVNGLPVMELRLTSLDGWFAVGKRIIDIVGSLVGIFLLAPLLMVVALLVKLTDPAGPVLYRQERLGRGGRPIGICKFRSMKWAYSTGPDRPYKSAEEAFAAMGRQDLCLEFAIEQKVGDDPRVSRLGRFLRSTSLDELPQLFNALAGDLSLVGPRPITPIELERYGAHSASFLATKPGITGLWQVSGRSTTGYDERVKLDVFYVENWSPKLDIAILFKTVVTVAARRGAY
jgi:exopolysaccharide production protein ExoY